MRYLALAALLTAATAAHAGDLVPYEAESIALGSIRGVAYFTKVEDGFRIVITLADGEAGLPFRFEATLADNQTFTISVPGKLGELGQIIGVSRAGDRLVVSDARPAVDNLVVTGVPADGAR